MLKAVVKDGTPVVKSGVSKKTQRPYSMRVQSVWVDLGKAFPNEVQVTLADGQAPFPVGEYEIGLECFHVSSFGDIAVDLRKMKPVQPAAARKVG